jgi:hypothetical protein
MTTKNLILLIIIATALGCTSNTETEQADYSVSKANVTVVSPKKGSINNHLLLFAQTMYLKKNQINAPISGYISKVNIYLGKKVKKGDILYVLETKERVALKNKGQILDSTLTNFGVILIKATDNGVISTFDKQQIGDYVLEGTLMCTLAENSSLAFKIDVPFENLNLVKVNPDFLIELPDQNQIPARITTYLTSVNNLNQTQAVMAKAKKSISLPENLLVKALFPISQNDSTQILPKSAVQTDELMTEFWVMKLINDSTAVKTIVTTGVKDDYKIEIISPVFYLSDQIISTGAYGLEDTAFVQIHK